MAKIWIRNGKVWDGDRFFYSNIYIEKGVIKEISKNTNLQADFVYDAKGQIVSVGLIDSHLHMRNISNNSLGVDVWACYPFGVTCAVEAWAEQYNQEAIETNGIKSLVFLGTVIKNGHLCTKLADLHLPKYKEKAIGLKVCFDTTSSDAKDITPVQEAVAYAEKHGLKVMVHCNHSPVPMMEIVKTLRKGDVLTHAYHGGENNASEDNFDCLRVAKEKGVILDVGVAGHIHTDFGVYREALKKGFAPDLIGSDLTLYSAFKRGGRYGLTACMNIARGCGQDEESIFKCVTSTPAKVFGKEQEWGYMKEGRTADIAVIAYEDDLFDLTDENGNRVAWQKGYRCKLTIANGEVVFRD